MSASLPHYKMGPASLQVATLVFGGQLVEPNTQSAGTTDYTVKPAVSAFNCMGVAGNDANVLTAQSGSPNTYGEPLIDISVLTDYCAVYAGGYDIWAWYSGQVIQGQKLIIDLTAAKGTVTAAGSTPDARSIVGVCTHPGGVATAMLTQAIGGLGSAVYFLGRMRIF
jgi:hypothetical protein